MNKIKFDIIMMPILSTRNGITPQIINILNVECDANQKLDTILTEYSEMHFFDVNRVTCFLHKANDKRIQIWGVDTPKSLGMKNGDIIYVFE